MICNYNKEDAGGSHPKMNRDTKPILAVSCLLFNFKQARGSTAHLVHILRISNQTVFVSWMNAY